MIESFENSANDDKSPSAFKSRAFAYQNRIKELESLFIEKHSKYQNLVHEENGWMMKGANKGNWISWKWRFFRCSLSGGRIEFSYYSSLKDNKEIKTVKLPEFYEVVNNKEPLNNFPNSFNVVTEDRNWIFVAPNSFEKKMWMRFFLKGTKPKQEEGVYTGWLNFRPSTAKFGEQCRRYFKFDFNKGIVSLFYNDEDQISEMKKFDFLTIKYDDCGENAFFIQLFGENDTNESFYIQVQDFNEKSNWMRRFNKGEKFLLKKREEYQERIQKNQQKIVDEKQIAIEMEEEKKHALERARKLNLQSSDSIDDEGSILDGILEGTISPRPNKSDPTIEIHNNHHEGLKKRIKKAPSSPVKPNRKPSSPVKPNRKPKPPGFGGSSVKNPGGPVKLIQMAPVQPKIEKKEEPTKPIENTDSKKKKGSKISLKGLFSKKKKGSTKKNSKASKISKKNVNQNSARGRIGERKKNEVLSFNDRSHMQTVKSRRRRTRNAAAFEVLKKKSEDLRENL